MSTPEQDLAAKLAAFETAYPAEGKSLRGLVTRSPELNARLVEAVRQGHLDGGFAPDSDPGNAGSYSPRDETLYLSPSLLRGAATNPEIANTLLMTVGHEAEHAVNKDGVLAMFDRRNDALQSIADGPPPRDYTGPIAAFMSEARLREANDEIAGVNVLAAQIVRDNPGASQSQLYQALAESSGDVTGYFNISGAATNPVYTPKSGISFNSKFQIEPTATNIETFGQHFFDARRYPEVYGQISINVAASFEDAARTAELAVDPTATRSSPTVNLKAPGIGSSPSLPSGFNDSSLPRLSTASESTERATPVGPTEAAPDDAFRADAHTQQPSPKLSQTSERLLQESEQHVRGVAERRQLGWDSGMDNTVHAMARTAREAGLTGITHFKASEGTLRLAQHDGFTIKEARLDAHAAANTPHEQSREQLHALDRSAAQRDSANAHPPTPRQLESEMQAAR